MSDTAFLRQTPDFGQRLRAWRDQHLRSAVVSVAQMLGKPLASAMTIGVIALALALPLGLGVIVLNLQQLAGEVQDARGLSVFLRDDADEASARALQGRLSARSDVAEVELRTPAQAAQEMADEPGMREAFAALESNPLPYTLLITPKDDGAALAADLRAEVGIAEVQQDAQWRQRLNAWLALGQRFAWVLAALLVAGLLLVVGNTIRLDLGSRRDEIAVLQELGATDGFIRRPFLYQGLWLGALGGLGALAVLAAALYWLHAPLVELLGSYQAGFAPRGIGWREGAAIMLGAGLLGWLGAWLASGHHLRHTRP